MVRSSSTGEPRHPIGVVALRTGLPPSTLRSWERRYGVVEPPRSEGGRRLYTDSDLERLRLLKEAVDAGRRIGEVAELDDRALQAAVRGDQEGRRRGRPSQGAPSGARFLEEGLRHVRGFGSGELERTLRGAILTMGAGGFVEEVLDPLAEKVGELLARGAVSGAGVRLAAEAVARVASWIGEAERGGGVRPELLVGTPPGERGEFGIAGVVLTAASVGRPARRIGLEVPPAEIAQVLRARDGAGVVWVSESVVDAAQVREWCARLAGTLPEDVEKGLLTRAGSDGGGWVGGLTVWGSLAELREGLAEPTGGRFT